MDNKMSKSTKINYFLSSELFYFFKKSKITILAFIVLVIIILLALVGPIFTIQNPYDLSSLDLANSYIPPVWLQTEEMGLPDYSSQFFLGTDQQGRDMFSAIVYGSRVSLFIGIVATIFSAFIGVFLGLISGYFGGKIDGFIMRIADIQLSFPSMLIALFLMGAFGRGLTNILICLTLVGWVKYARTVRGETLSVKNMEYIEAAKVIGLKKPRIIFKHVMPNVFTSIIVLTTIQIGSFILFEATLSFLGLGVSSSKPSLGMLCNEGFKVFYGGLWWVSIFPGLYIVIIVFAINLLGDFLRDQLNPKLK